MITALLLGAGAGVGLWALSVWATPARPPLHRALGRLTDIHSHESDGTGWQARLARPLRALGLPTAALRRDLALLDRSVDAHLAGKMIGALAGLLAPPVGAALLALLGAHPAPTVPALVALAGAGVGFLAPDLRARGEATRGRAGFRHALSSYLDLVVVSLAGGAGVDGALTDAAAVGHGPALDRLRRTLATARLTRTPPWQALRDLGGRLGIPDLAELAGSLALAGAEGAKIRASLAAKADSLRAHLLTDTEGQARAATERMSLPWLCLFLGFLIFVGYPALHQILTGL